MDGSREAALNEETTARPRPVPDAAAEQHGEPPALPDAQPGEGTGGSTDGSTDGESGRAEDTLRGRLLRVLPVAGGVLGMGMLLLVGAVVPLYSLLPSGASPDSGTPAEAARPPVGQPDKAYSVTEPFLPSLSYEADGGWPYRHGISQDFYRISRDDGSALDFINVGEIYDPEDPAMMSAAAPEGVDGMAGWFRDHPRLAVGEPKGVEVGGARGLQFDVAVSSGLEDYAAVGCQASCVPLFRTSDGGTFSLEAGRSRMILLDVGGETVAVVVEGGTDGFEEFLAEAEGVLGSVKWGAPPGATYTTEQFSPSLSLRAGEGWPYRHGIATGLYQIWQTDGTLLSFLNVRDVYDPKDPILTQPAPEDLAAWFGEHPHLDAGSPEPVEVGGASGVAFDVTVAPLPEGHASGTCDTPCVPLFPQDDGSAFVFLPANKNRVVVLDLAGETVVVTVEGPQEAFEDFAPRAEEVLDTVRWEQ